MRHTADILKKSEILDFFRKNEEKAKYNDVNMNKTLSTLVIANHISACNLW